MSASLTHVLENRIHFDLTTRSRAHRAELVQRVRTRGGDDLDIGQGDDEPHEVMADPEGNPFCVIPPENRFLAKTGSIGAVNADGTHAVGVFWSQVLGWPLVWDHDEETAIQPAHGGTIVQWSGPPLMEVDGRDRLRFDIESDDLARDRQLLLDAGARPSPESDELWRDPDGTEFHLNAARRARCSTAPPASTGS